MLARRVSPLAFAVALGLSYAAHAQTPPQTPPSPDASEHQWAHGGMDGQRAQHEAGRLRALHEILNIRPDQEGAFQAFAESMRPAPPQGESAPGGTRGGPGGWRNGATIAPPPLPQRLDLMVQKFDERTGRMREGLVRHVEAVKAFYAVLSPDQRRVFEALPGLMGHGGMGMGMGMGRPGMGMPPHDRMGTGDGMGRPGE